ncbi:hypothetical protein J7M28_02640 [bacterium]|nr:hypothetical protein [bacterium]
MKVSTGSQITGLGKMEHNKALNPNCTNRLARYLAFALIAILALGLLAGCGKKGPPTLPRKRGPAPVMDLQAIARGGVVTLYFTLPKENMDETPFRDFTRVDVFRRWPKAKTQEKRSFWGRMFGPRKGKSSLIISREASELVPGRNKADRNIRIVDDMSGIEDVRDWFGTVVEYYVVVRGRGFRKSPPSKLSRAMPVLGPAPPEKLTSVAGDRAVKVEWAPQTMLVTGDPIDAPPYYNIYRLPVNGWPLISPINKKPISETEYIDLDVKNDVEYRYVVTTISAHGELWAESATSATLLARPEDRIPPQAPFDLEATAGKGVVNLLWSADEAPDHAGFFIYRKKAGQKSFIRLTPEPSMKTMFVDRTVFPGTEYVYCVTAIDNSSYANESKRSNKVSVTAR